MTGQEARGLTPDQRSAELTDLRRKLHTLRTQAVTEKVEDNSQFRKIRRDIARLLGVQTQVAGGGGTAVAEKPAKAPAKKPVAKKPAPKKPAEKKN